MKEASKKAKRAKFDTEAVHSVSDKLQKEAAGAGAAATQRSASSGGAPAAGRGVPGSFAPQVGKAQSLEELRARLHAKIADLKSGRQAHARPEGDGEDAPRRSRGTKRVRGEAGEGEETGPTKRAPRKKKTRGGVGRPRTVSKGGAEGSSKASASTPVDLSFGVLDTSGATGLDKATSKLDKRPRQVKALKGLLAKAEANQAKLEALRASKQEAAAQSMEQSAAWEAALKRAKGEKVKDDPKLLRKALKRREKAKEKSRAKWAERTEAVKEAQAAKQARRTSNLAKRAEGKKAARMRKAGIVTPGGAAGKSGGRGGRMGFEGRKSSFIN